MNRRGKLILLSAVLVSLLGFMSSSEFEGRAATLPDQCTSPTEWCGKLDTDFFITSSLERQPEQQLRIPALTESQVTPGIYLFQVDDGKWRVESNRQGNPDFIPQASGATRSNPWPEEEIVYTSVWMDDPLYLPKDGFLLQDGSGRKFPYMDFHDYHIYSAIADSRFIPQAETVDLEVEDGLKLIFDAAIGGLNGSPHAPMVDDNTGVPYYGKYEDSPSGPKFKIGYKGGINIKWAATYFENKKIRIEGASEMNPSTTQQLKALVETGVG